MKKQLSRTTSKSVRVPDDYHAKAQAVSEITGKPIYEVFCDGVDAQYICTTQPEIEHETTDFDNHVALSLGEIAGIFESNTNFFRRNVPIEMYEDYKNTRGYFKIPPEVVYNIFCYLVSKNKIKTKDKQYRILRRIQRLYAIKALFAGMYSGDII